MTGTHQHTGKPLGRFDAARQNVDTILRTPTRTEPMAPEFGVDHLSLIDRSMGAAGRARVAAQSGGALARQLRGVTVKRVQPTVTEDGQVDVGATVVVDGVEVTSERANLEVDPYARVYSPAGYYAASGFDALVGAWSPELGAGPDLSGAGTVDGEFIAIPDDGGLAWPGDTLPVAASGTWTAAVRIRLTSTAFLAGLLSLVDGSTTIASVVAVGSASGLATYLLGPSASGAAHEGEHGLVVPDLVVWMEWESADGAHTIRAAIGGRTSTYVVAAPAGALSLRVGGGVDVTNDFFPFLGTVSLGFRGAVSHVGVWSGDLSARRRLAIEAEWRRTAP